MYLQLRRQRWLLILVIWTRLVIGFAFVPSGLKKVMGERFTVLGTDNPIGFFFEGLYQSGFYWKFLGLSQLLAALLLMSQRFATLGALLFFSIICNIWVITLSLHFAGTTIVTSLMLLANLGLLAWDYNKFKGLFYRDRPKTRWIPDGTALPNASHTWEWAGFLLFIWAVSGSLLLEHTSNRLVALLFLLSLPLVVILITIIDNRQTGKHENEIVATE